MHLPPRFTTIASVVLTLAASFGAVGAAAAPQVTNISAQQRPDGSGLVDIFYNVSGANGPMFVDIVFSNNDGATWNVIPTPSLIWGDVGPGVANGSGRHIIWDVGRDQAEIFWPQTRARIRAAEVAVSTNFNLPGGVPLEMVRIPAGAFTMGSVLDPDWTYDNEMPPRTVTINYDFYMGTYPITRAQWAAVMGSTPSCTGPCTPDTPVHNVSWNMAQNFINAINQLGIGTFRLPSEAEWEYAARAGTQTRWYHGDDPEQLGDYAWYSANNSPNGPKPVGQKLPNAFGLYDTAGNVWEWVQDRYNSNYNGAPSDGSAWEEDTSTTNRVLRGGSFNPSAGNCRPARRSYSSPGLTSNGRGFRVVRTF